MTDYSKLSDDEINSRVAETLPIRFTYYADYIWNAEEECRFAPCNNPSDAWPIIADKKISVMWMTGEGQWCAWANGELEEGCWEWRYCPENYSHGDNPLRAAMIVYLMMKESENGI